MMSNEWNKNDGLSALDSLTPEEKEMALKILQQMAKNGNSDLLDDLKYSDFAEVPVDIDTFLDDDLYLGKGIWAYDQVTDERKCTLFPYWRETLNRLFPDNITTAYNTLILTGAIGLGKTLVASIALLYLLYRMLCLKDPYGYYGLMPMDKITFSTLNITLETARGVAWDKIQQLIQGSEWFMSHGSLNASRTAPTWQPDKHIELIFGSSNNHVIGRALFANISDEVNFSGGNSKNVEAQKKKLKKMVAQIDARMVSRFGKGTRLPTLNIIASSKDVEQAFLEDYIKRKAEDAKTLIIDEPQWVVRNDKGTPNDPGAFWVAVGGKMLASELLPVDVSDEVVQTYRVKGYKMIKIPPIFRRDFETNMDQALMDIAGEASTSAAKFISGERITAAKITSYENPFVKDIIEVGDGLDDYLQYANFFDLSKIKPEDKARPLFIHLDMSTGGKGKGDKTGIAGVWITGKSPSIPGQESSLTLRYKLAFSVSVKAPKGHNISFIKNQNFIKWLRDQGFSIKMISADTFQSAAVLQELSYAGFNTKIQSVDRTNSEHICEPYYYLKSAIYDRRVEIYDKCDLLTEELVNLEKEASGKIEHPEGGKYGSKDQADAFCGALYAASQFAEEYAYDYGETLAATLDANLEETSNDKAEWLDLYTKDLIRTYAEIEDTRTQQEKDRLQQLQNIADGIILI